MALTIVIAHPFSVETVTLTERDLSSFTSDIGLNFPHLTGNYGVYNSTAQLVLRGSELVNYDGFERFKDGRATVYNNGVLSSVWTVENVVPQFSGACNISLRLLISDSITAELEGAHETIAGNASLLNRPAPVMFGYVETEGELVSYDSGANTALVSIAGRGVSYRARTISLAIARDSGTGVPYSTTYSTGGNGTHLTVTFATAPNISSTVFQIRGEEALTADNSIVGQLGLVCASPAWAHNSVTRNFSGTYAGIFADFSGFGWAENGSTTLARFFGVYAGSLLCAVWQDHSSGAPAFRLKEFKASPARLITPREFKSFEPSNIEPKAWSRVNYFRRWAPGTIPRNNAGNPTDPPAYSLECASRPVQPHIYYQNARAQRNEAYETVLPTVNAAESLCDALHAAQSVTPRQVTIQGTSGATLGECIQLGTTRLNMAGQTFFVVRLLTNELTKIQTLTGVRIA